MRSSLPNSQVKIAPFVKFIISLSSLVVLFLLKDWWEQASLRQISLAVLITGVFALIMVGTAFREKTWSLPFLFLLILFLFHGGLYLYPAFTGVPSPYLETVASSWFSPQLAARSAYLLILAFFAYSLGSTLAFLNLTSGCERKKGALEGFDRARRLSDSFAIVGSLTVVLSVSFWLAVCIQAAGPFFFLGSYQNFLSSTAGAGLGSAYVGVALGVALMAQNLQARTAQTGLAFFLLFAVLGLPIGLRNEVLIPLAVGVAVYARTQVPPKFKLFAFGFTIMLIMVAGIRQVRQSGLAGFSASETEVTPLAAIEEMGYSVRVLFTSVQWHEVWNEPYLLGKTYLTPIVRFFERLLGIRTVPAQEEFGLMNVEIAARVGQIGGSVVGEAHHNFGSAGVVSVLFLLGFLLSKCQLRSVTPLMMAVFGLVGVLALTHIRDSFTPIFAWTIYGLSLIAVALVLEVATRNRASKIRYHEAG